MLKNFCDRLIQYSFYLLFFLVPLAFTPLNYELFEFNKMILVYLLTIVIVGAWLIKMILQGRILFRRSFMDIPLFCFLVSQFLSFLVSIDRHTSLWGYYSRFHGGLASTICYLLLYWAFVSNTRDTSEVPPFANGGTGWPAAGGTPPRWKKKGNGFPINCLYALLASGFLVASYGILEHFGIDKDRWVQDVQNRVFSTLGQPNWLAAWLAAIIPLTWAFALNSKFQALNTKPASPAGGQITNSKSQNFKLFGVWNLENWSLFRVSSIYYLLFTIYYLCLLYTKSRSGLLGLAAAYLVFWPLAFWLHRRQPKKILKPFLIFNFLFLIFNFFIGSPWTPSFPEIASGVKGPAIEVDSRLAVSESSNIRRVVWRGAIEIFRHYPILGTGPETFAYSYYWYRPREHNDLSEWDFLYNKAHNEYLNFLATTGLVGLGSYLMVIGAFVWWCIRIYTNKNNPNKSESPMSRLFGLIIRIIPIRMDSDQKLSSKNHANQIVPTGLLAGYVSILVTNFFGFSVVPVALLFFLYPAMAATLLLLSSYRSANRIPPPERKCSCAPERWQWVAIAIILLITNYSLLITLRFWYADTLLARGEKQTETGQHEQAIESLKKAIEMWPNEPVFHNQLAYNLGQLAAAVWEKEDKDLAAKLATMALNESNQALKISPYNLNFWKNRTRICYQLAEIEEKYDQEALISLLKAAELAPTDAKVFYNLALLYGRLGQDQTAIQSLQHTIELRPNYADARFALALFWEKEGKIEEAKKQLKYILEKINPEYEAAMNKLKELENKTP